MIKVLWPTIRPEVALKMADLWCDRSKDMYGVEFYFAVNDDTPNSEVLEKIKNCGPSIEKTGNKTGVTHSATVLTRKLFNSDDLLDNDIVILASDDFEAPQNWDKNLIDQYVDFDGALIVNDGYKKTTNIIPMPVVSGKCLRRLNGIIYHPAYHHFYSDQELFDVCTELGIIRNLRETVAPVFSHRHWSFSGGRDRDHFDERNNSQWNSDKAIYESRSKLSVEEKISLKDAP